MEISAQHELFMEAFLDSGDAYAAAEQAGFSSSYGPTLFHKLRERIMPKLEDRLAMLQVKAVRVMDESMGTGALNPKQDIRMRAAAEVMDRGGLTKKQSLDINTGELPAVMVLPAKNPVPEAN